MHQSNFAYRPTPLIIICDSSNEAYPARQSAIIIVSSGIAGLHARLSQFQWESCDGCNASLGSPGKPTQHLTITINGDRQRLVNNILFELSVPEF
jgi:hypothetical protein